MSYQANTGANIQASQQYTLDTHVSMNNPSVLQPDRVSDRRIPERSQNTQYTLQDEQYIANQLTNQGDTYEYQNHRNPSNYNQIQGQTTSSQIQGNILASNVNQSRAAPFRQEQFNSNIRDNQNFDQNSKQYVQATPSSNFYADDYKTQGNQQLFSMNLNQRPNPNNVVKTTSNYQTQEKFKSQGFENNGNQFDYDNVKHSSRNQQEKYINQGLGTQNTQYIDQEPDITPIDADRPSYAQHPNQYYNSNQNQQINRPLANPTADARYASNINMNQSPSGQKKFHNKIFDVPMSGRVQNRGTHNTANSVQQNRYRDGEEQAIMGPSELNRTIQLNDENMTIYDHHYDQGFDQNQNNQFLGKQFYNNYGPQETSQYVGLPPNQSRAVQNYQGMGQTPQGYAQNQQLLGNAQIQLSRNPNQLGKNVPLGKYPPIIHAFMTNDLQIDYEIDQLFMRPQEQNIPIILVSVKQRVEGKMDLCRDSLHNMHQGQVEISRSCDEIHKNFLQTEHICLQQQKGQGKGGDLEVLQYAINYVNQQKRIIESVQQFVKKQIQLCDPDLIRKPLIPDLILNDYVKETQRTLEDFKEPFLNRFNESILSCMNTTNFNIILTQISKFNKPDRIVMIKNKASEDKNHDLEYLHSLIKYLYDCDGLLLEITKEIESAVFKYAQFLLETEKKLALIYSYLQVYITVLNQSIAEYKEINQYQHNFEQMIASTDNITRILLNDIRFPYIQNQEYNENIFNEMEIEKNGLMKSLVDYNSYIRDKLNFCVQIQQRDNVPFLIQTPMTRLIVSQSNEIERLKKRLDNIDYVIKAFKSLQYTTVQAQQYEQQAKDWLKANQNKYHTETHLRDKVEELQGIIIKLIDMRDKLGLHHLKYSHEYLYKDVMIEEYNKISEIIDRIQDMQIEVARKINPTDKADYSVAQAGQKKQNQVASINQMLNTGSFNALPILQENDERTKRSRYSPKKQYPDDVDRFNYEVTKTRHLLQQNAQRQMHF